MAPKPASTAGKAPASTASKAPAKTTEGGSKAAKKTSKPAASGDDTKKKRRKGRKETYSSYIYKGELNALMPLATLHTHALFSPQAGPPRHWYLQQGDGHPQLVRQRYLRAYCH